MNTRVMWVLIASACFGCTLFAQSVPITASSDAVATRPFFATPNVASDPPAVVLAPSSIAAPQQVDALEVWNRHRNSPIRNGFPRSLVDTLAVRIVPNAVAKGASAAAGGRITLSDRGVIWSTSIRVENAYGLRLHLENAKLPANATLWVHGDQEPATAFDSGLIDPAGGLWTPSTAGDTIHLEIEVPFGSAQASFEIREVMELVEVRPPGTIVPNDSASCLVDVNCVSASAFPAVELVKKAIAQIFFTNSDGNSYICSGGLLNDMPGSYTPWFLTANHCIHDQSAASSLEARWDYRFAGCGSYTFPPFSAAPRSNGATLLAHSTSSDYSFLRLNAIPAGRAFLGWTTIAPVPGTTLFRVSHPAPNQIIFPQMFSTRTVNPAVGTCSELPRPNFTYSTVSSGDAGGTYGGSSGSPVMLSNGQVVGQLFGSCADVGIDLTAGCDPRLSIVDGAFGYTYGAIASYLSPPPCTYSLSSQSAAFAAAGGSGSVGVAAASSCSAPWTATTSSSWITITSGGSGSGAGTVTYSVAANTSTSTRNGTMTIAGQTFTVTQQAPTTTGCGNDSTLCLLNGRFAVSATWRASDGSSGQGHAVSLTSDTGHFWFFGSNNVEVVVKVLDGCALSRKFWVFAGGLTNVNVVMTVRDVRTGTIRTYTNPINTAFQPIQDTSAFATCP